MAVAFYDPRLGVVVVATHSPPPRPGGGCDAACGGNGWQTVIAA
ncbi:MAG: hypothetical protein LUQ59_02460 [Methanothrix sp.]|nr:hypothetical protein [Methanothrix sp.]